MKKNFTFFALYLMTVSAYAQLSGSFNYAASIPQAAMARNINPVHQVALTGGYTLPRQLSFLTVGAELGLGMYANLSVPVTLQFGNSCPTRTNINYSSNTFNANGMLRIDLKRDALITPYLTVKGGVYNFFSNIRIDDPQDADGCRALESKSILSDNTFAYTYGGGLRYQIFRNRYLRYGNQHYIDVQVTNTTGGTVSYINTKKLKEPHQHNATVSPNSTDGYEVKPLEVQFINVQSNIVHNHMVAEVFKTQLRLLNIRVGYFVEF